MISVFILIGVGDSGGTHGCSEPVAEDAVSIEDEPKAQATADSLANPVTDTTLEAEPKVAEPHAEDVQPQEDASGQEGKESSGKMDVAVTEPTPVSSSSSPSRQIPLPAVLDEAESVAMETSEAGSEVQNEEVSDRTPPHIPHMEPSASDTDDRAGQSEDEDDEEELLDEAHCKSEDDPKQEGDAQETGIKSELLLDEMSNMSHGDESSSGFLGSPAEVDSQLLSMDHSVVPAGRARSDSLLTESDEFLPFDALKCDGEKLKRRGSPGRSRVKQVECMHISILLLSSFAYSSTVLHL